MGMRNVSLWKTIDWWIICVYVILVIAGWFSICGASYDFSDRDFFDFSTRAGKQFIWIICSFLSNTDAPTIVEILIDYKENVLPIVQGGTALKDMIIKEV